MLLGCDQPKYLWAEAINYATWLKNQFPSHAIPETTPYALVNKTKPSLAMAHEFSIMVYVHMTTGGKLEARVNAAIYVGVDEESKGYHIWWAKKCRVSLERNVTFPPIANGMVPTNDVPDEGEYSAPVDVLPTKNIVQPVATIAPPLPMPPTPPQSAAPLPIPIAPRTTHIRPPAGYY
jgi:hypothetical protein